MGNRGIITLEDSKGHKHPVALYLHWNGGLESILGFMQFTWDTFERGRDDMWTFQARLCQVVGNFFPDGLSLYGMARRSSTKWGAENGIFHFRVDGTGVHLVNRPDEVEDAKRHEYWTSEKTILDGIREHMPAKSGRRGV